MINNENGRPRGASSKPLNQQARADLFALMNRMNVSAVVDSRNDWVVVNMGEWRDLYKNTTGNKFQIYKISDYFYEQQPALRGIELNRVIAGGDVARDFIAYFRNLSNAELSGAFTRTATPLPPDIVRTIDNIHNPAFNRVTTRMVS